MIRDEELLLLEEAYETYAIECGAAMRIALAKIYNVEEATRSLERWSPFDSIDSRLKTFESAIEKCNRKCVDLTIDSIKENVRDVAGIRIITPFEDDIHIVAGILEHIPGINVVQKKDYVKEPKANGYSSLHLNVQIEIYLPAEGSKLVPVEIQVRDKAMDLWATIEHIVSYKNDNPSPEVNERFKAVSDTLARFDQMAIELRDSSR